MMYQNNKILIILSCMSVFLSSLISVSVARALVPGDNPNYQRLAKQLPFYQAAVQQPWPRLTSTETLGLGSQGPAVFMLRQRLCATHDLSEKVCQQDSQNNYFDETVAEGVAFFQERHGLAADGKVGELTRQALNVTPQQRVHQIQINLQRWSRLIDLAEPAYIWINIPDHYLRSMRQGEHCGSDAKSKSLR